MCRSMIEQITEKVEARSEANRMLDLVMERSVWRIRIAEVWKVRETVEAIEKDDRLERRVVAKRKWVVKHSEKQLNTLEEMMACLTMCSKEMEVEMDWNEVELEEHMFMENWMKELGIEENNRETVMMVDFDWEMQYLDRVLAYRESANDEKMVSENDKDMVVPDADDYWMVEGPENENQLVVNTVAYFSEGTWFMDNWVLGQTPTKRMGSETLCDRNTSLEARDMSVEMPTIAPNLILFSLVGTAGGTRKRTFAGRKGRWWSASRWWPGPRTCEPWKVGRRTLLKDITGGLNSKEDTQVVTRAEFIAEFEQKKQDLTQWLVAEQIPISDKSKLREYCCTVGSNTQDIHIAGAAGQGGQQHHQGHVLVAEGAGDSALTRNSAQITNISISVQEQQHAEVQPDGGAGDEYVLVADGARDGAQVTNISVSVQEHQHEGVQQERGEEEHILLDSGGEERVQEEHVLVAGGAAVSVLA